MKLSEDLLWRESIYDMTDPELAKKLDHDSLTFYLGADPTADSLHIGHLAVYVFAKRLVDAGHKAILLIGGGTGLIGDPSGKNTERQLLTLFEASENAKALRKQVESLLDVAAHVNNFDWLSQIDMITFLRDYGKHFNLNQMLAKDTVKSRLDVGISYTEFSYQILQSLDWHHLYTTHGCNMQIGGQDQWGNITAGTDLIRKIEGSEAKVYGLTIPLIVKADGQKFGKTAGGSVWLSPERTSPFDFYQFWLNASDDDAVIWLKKFTFLDKTEIETIIANFEQNKGQRLAQKKLADEVTRYVHGKQHLIRAKAITEALFSGDVKQLNANEISIAFKDLETIAMKEELPLIDALLKTKLASSKREAREFIQNGAVSINGDKMTELEHVITLAEAIDQTFIVLKRGKKKHALLKLEDF